MSDGDLRMATRAWLRSPDDAQAAERAARWHERCKVEVPSALAAAIHTRSWLRARVADLVRRCAHGHGLQVAALARVALDAASAGELDESERLVDEARAARPWPPSPDAALLLAVLRLARGAGPTPAFGPIVRGLLTRCDQMRSSGRVLRWLGLVPDRALAARAANELLAALPDAVAWSALQAAGRGAASNPEAVLRLVERLGRSWTASTRPDPLAVHEVLTSAGLEWEVFEQAREFLEAGVLAEPRGPNILFLRLLTDLARRDPAGTGRIESWAFDLPPPAASVVRAAGVRARWELDLVGPHDVPAAIEYAAAVEDPDTAHRSEVLGRLLALLAQLPDGVEQARALALARLDQPDLDPSERATWLNQVLLVTGHVPALGDVLEAMVRRATARRRAPPGWVRATAAGTPEVHRRPELVRALASAAARRVRAREVGERYFAGQTLAECVAAAAALGLPEQAAWERLHLEVVAKARIPDLPDLLEGVAEAGARSEDGAVVRARLGRLADAVKVIFHGPRTASLLTIGRCDPPWLLASVEALLGP